MNNMNAERSAAERRTKVAVLYLQGRKQYEIADELGISTGCLSNDLSAVYKDWEGDLKRSRP